MTPDVGTPDAGTPDAGTPVDLTPVAEGAQRSHLRLWRAGLSSLAVLIVAGLLAVPLQVRALAVARAERDGARSELREARGRESTASARASNQQTVLELTRSDRGRHARDADATDARIGDHQEDRKAEVAATAEARSGAESAAERLERVRAVLGLQQLAIAPLRSCLDGVDRANQSLAAGNSAAAADALGAASDSCMQVRSGSAPPSFPYDFPDPHVTAGPAGRWWAYATNSTAGAVQLISSADLDDWRVEGNALAGLPGWATPGATWAPAVVHHGGRWLLYYTVREARSGLQCISVAASQSPAGPFHDASTGPLVCERGEGGSIDPDPVVDADGRLYLLWKTELDTLGGAAELRGALLGANGTELAGEVATLLRASQSWTGRTIEGPAMVQHSGGYHLLYSGGSWNGSGYAVGAARCETILGPCTPQPAPVLETVGGITGPGGLSVFATPYGPAVAYHAWQGDAVGYPDNRYLHVGDLQIRGGKVAVRP